MDDVKVYDISEKGLFQMKMIEDALKAVKFQTSGNRQPLTHNGARPTSQPCGMKKMLDGTYGVPSFDRDNPHIYPIIRDFVNDNIPSFDFNAGYINKNVQMIPHKDKNNCDTSLIFGLGDYTGGRLMIEGKPYEIRNKVLEFDGKRKEHWTEYFEGDRYSVVIYKI